MSYESAPATVMLATSCVVCGRPLVDSLSVERGMGPDCRRKYASALDGSDGGSDDARSAANRCVYRLALRRSEVLGSPNAEESVALLKEVRKLGFQRLADVLEERLCDVVLEEAEDRGRMRLALTAPFVDGFVSDLKRLKREDGFELERKWDASSARWLFPPDDEARRLLWRVLKVHFKERLGRSPRGPFAVVSKTMPPKARQADLPLSLPAVGLSR